MTLKLTTSAAAVTLFCAAPAFADVTAADVWANQQALYTALGGTLNGTLGADGTISPELNLILPQGAGSMQVRLGDISLTENGDGGVTITYPSPLNLTIAGGIAGEGSFTATVVMTNDSYTTTATGEPGDVSYATSGTNWALEIADVTFDGAEGFSENASITGGMTLDAWDSQSQVTEGPLVAFSAQTELGTQNIDFTMIADTTSSKSVQTSQPISATFDAMLPAGGSDLMNLSAALREGLSLAMNSTGGGTTSTQVVTIDGSEFSNQTTETGPQAAQVTFDENGLKLAMEAEDFNLALTNTLIAPVPIEMAIEAMTAAYDLPLNAAEEPQDIRLATSLQGITLAESLWSMFDPAGQLPRDPAEVTFDLTGTGTNGIDLLDFAKLSTLAGPPPVELNEATIENLNIKAVGAEIAAEGAMTFDWTDFQTIPGMPRPEGAVTVNLNGANKLMDTLVAMGFIPEDQLLMPRMMMGMFATPVGDDQLETVLEVNSEGHVLANGQRLQ